MTWDDCEALLRGRSIALGEPRRWSAGAHPRVRRLAIVSAEWEAWVLVGRLVRVVRGRWGRRLHLEVGDHVGDECPPDPGEVVGLDLVVAGREGEGVRAFLVDDAIAAGVPGRVLGGAS